MKELGAAFGCGLLGSLSAFGVLLLVLGIMLADREAMTWGVMLAVGPAVLLGAAMRRRARDS